MLTNTTVYDSLNCDENGIWVSNVRDQVSYPSEGNDLCFATEDRSFWFRHRNRVILELMKLFPFKNNFADVGGGNGFQSKSISEEFREQEIFLVEPGYQGCRNARSRGVKNVYNLTSERFDFERFDIGGVGLFDVVEHIENHEDFLGQIARQTKPGTMMYITVPAFNTLWSGTDDLAGHFRRYTKGSLAKVLSSAGFETLYSTYFFTYVPVPLFAVRVLPQRLGLNNVSEEELLKKEYNYLNNPKAENFVVRTVHSIELFLVKSRISLPLGGSVAAVARVK